MRNSALVALGLLGACGGGGSSTPTTPSTPPTIPVSSACGALGQAVSASTAIVNGGECSTANSPVVLLNMKDSGGQQLGSCSGTVIAQRAILTAAHCIGIGAATGTIKVFLGSGPELVTQSFAVHPSWREANNTAFDAAVVLMPEDIGRTPLPLLLSRDARVSENAILAGWGKDSIAGVPATLRAGVATITAVSALTLQTTFTTTASSVCQGDSGGPILLSEGGGWAVGGVISANSTLACSSGDNFYANIRHPEISGFILGRVPDASRR